MHFNLMLYNIVFGWVSYFEEAEMLGVTELHFGYVELVDHSSIFGVAVLQKKRKYIVRD